MSRPEPTPETDQAIAEFRAESHRLWAVRGRRLFQCLLLILAGVAVFVWGALLRVDTLVWVVAVFWASGFVVLIDIMRIRFASENVDFKVRELDPDARPRPSLWKEFGFDIRTALGMRPDSVEMTP
ncbi:hypothetical protein [Cryobacterium zhongshanensis]|uniref:Uncharacterized protein n=1 Tax=Cryobacterium zhongshanensis TaxID=2928153 RepID=A0AA41QYD1_9MICO|nr:hypothetical protein [Cryobacterium zhongshanensis]MCI4659747.1 hypothetical protein [Cryobacterium zhongshanensis]